MKKILFLLLFTVSIYGQTLQNPTFGIVTEKNNATDSTPAYFTTTQVDGVHKKTPAALIALKADLPTTYTTVVYVNSTDPNSATIFDDVNPPVTNDPLLDNDTANLYIGTDASTWVYNGSIYITKTVPATSNFFVKGFPNLDAGNNKDVNIERTGGIKTSQTIEAANVYAGGVLANSIVSNNETPNTIVSFDSSKQIKSLPTDTYPSLTELSYVKGATSPIQTQLNGKQSTLTNPVTGTGTTNYIAKFTGSGTVDNSGINQTPNGYCFSSGLYRRIYIKEELGAYGFKSVALDDNDFNRPIFFSGSTVRFFSGSTSSTVVSEKMRLADITGNLLVNTDIDNGVDVGQFNGSISATSYTGSATLTGTPTAPTAAPGTNDNTIANTAFVQAEKNLIAHWTKTGNAITNNNTGKIYFGAPATGSVGGVPHIVSSNQNIVTSGQFASTVGYGFADQSSGLFEIEGKLLLKMYNPKGVGIQNVYQASVSGTQNDLSFVNSNINPTSGNAVFNNIAIEPTINQTGGANGKTRSIYINPTLTSAADFRAIEVTAGKSMFQEVIANNVVRLKNYTVATLPTGTQGDTAYVTDALAPTYMTTVVGGGAIVTPVFYNGTAWVAH